jgi:branched-chain amino acid transport system substrate-binding protein
MRKSVVVMLAVALVLTLAAQARAQEPIKIGVPLALTGPLTVNGEDNRRGTLLYFEELGFQLAGRKVEVKVEDTEGKADVALTKVRKLAELDKVHAIVGIIGSHEAYAVRDYLHNSGVPTVITTAAANGVTLARKSPFIFRTAPDNEQEAGPMGYYAATKLGYKRAVVIASDFAAGREQSEGFKKAFTKAGGQVIQEVFAPLGTNDFAPFITRIRFEQVDVIWTWFAGAEPARVVNQLKEYGVKKPIVSQGAFTANYVLPSMGEAGLGILSAKHYSDVLETPENRRFLSAFIQKFKVKPDAWAEQGYVAAKAVGEAIKAIGGKVEDRQRLLEALRKTRFEGPAGVVVFNENQQRVVDVFIRRVEKSGAEYVNRPIDTIPGVSQNWSPN